MKNEYSLMRKQLLWNQLFGKQVHLGSALEVALCETPNHLRRFRQLNGHTPARPNPKEVQK